MTPARLMRRFLDGVGNVLGASVGGSLTKATEIAQVRQRGLHPNSVEPAGSADTRTVRSQRG